jgi:flagellar basal-body rod modification protein FlgD
MEITNNTNVSNAQFQTAVEKESLSNDDFMKLLLTELKYQDPTKPMDTQAMIDQTMQMSQIEANNANVKALASMQSSFTSSQMLNSVNIIGKHIDTGNRDIKLENSVSEFSVLFDEPVETGSVYIKNSAGSIVNTLELANLAAGTTTFTWDGKDYNNNQLPDDTYSLVVEAQNSSNQIIKANVGTHIISSLEFNNGNITAVADDYRIDINNIKEIW